MKWQKCGFIWKPNGKKWWARERAYLPTVDIRDDCIRIYTTSLDENMIGRIGYIDVDKSNPKKILYESEEPCLIQGEKGTFDEHGVVPSCILNFGKIKYLYYFGFMKTTEAPQILFTGLATSVDNGDTFIRKYQIPILDRTNIEFIARSASCVIKDFDRYKMWYTGSRTGFIAKYNGKDVERYSISYASSTDGEMFKMGFPCYIPRSKHEFGLARPWVIKEDRIYKMWYSIRRFDVGYRIGYAESKDGVKWIRKDSEVGIDVSETGWDSEQICFSCVVDVEDKRLMFYNGSGLGKSGVGYAQLCK